MLGRPKFFECFSRVGRAIHAVFSLVIDSVEGNSRFAYLSRILLIGTVLGSSAAFYLGTNVCSRDLQVIFWLGQVPLLSLAAISITLFFAFLFFVYIRIIRSHRIKYSLAAQQHKRMLTGQNLADDWVQRHCDLSRSRIRWCLFMLVILAGFSCYLGIRVGAVGAMLAHSLSNSCGLGGTSARLEGTFQQLKDFHQECPSTPVDQCEGFAAAFPPPAPYVLYLKKTMEELQCSGFCQAGEEPLFARQDGKMFAYTERCASRISKHLLLASSLVCYPCTIVGGVIAASSLWMSCWDDI